jgi:superfamily II DNA or RNA helicase
MKKVYAGATRDRKEFRFHRNLFKDLMQHLQAYGLRTSNMDIVDKPPTEPLRVTFPVNEDVVPRDYQVGLIDFLGDFSLRTKVTNLQTGKGKTLSALMAMVKIGMRTAIQLRGGYVSRWIDDLEGLFGFKKGDILVIRGRDALLSLINMAKADDLQAKVIIITNKTLYKLFEEFEKDGSDNYYGIRPEELYDLLRAGLRIVDEVHEDYHLSFRTDIYSNVSSSIHLSATLDTEDVFRRQMYDIALPQQYWYKGVEYDKYIQSYAMFYATTSESLPKLKLSERGQDSYSHGAYEKSILRQKVLKDTYLEICRYPIQRFYIEDDWQGGQKCIVFCYLVEFCVVLRDYLRGIYPELDIREFVAETDEKVLKEADIIVSTIKSAGTAQDIPDLKVSVLTQAVRKKEANIQTLGRLRKLKRWPNVTPVFVYLNNTSIETHTKYHEAKKEIFQGKVLSQREEHIPLRL